MTMTVGRLNALPQREAEEALLACCGSAEWARRLAAARPFADEEDLATASDRIWRGLSKADWLEAFAAHPRIGASASAGPAPAREWSRQEQRGAEAAPAETREALARANRDYEARFGHIFIVCASSRSADEMLSIARRRLGNDPDAELAVAAEEQRKITRLRLAKLFAGRPRVER